MVQVVIEAATQYILSDADWQWLQNNFNKPLKVLSLSFTHDDGALFCISVLQSYDLESIQVVTLFIDQNNLVYKLKGLEDL